MTSDALPFDDLARHAARSWFVDGHDYDDLLQEARIAAWKSSLTFDPSRGMAPRNYARLAIYAHLATVLRLSQTQKRAALHQFVSFSEPASGHAGMLRSETMADCRPGPQEQLEQRAELASLIDGAHLTEIEHRVVVGLAVGMRYDEIDSSYKRVDNALQRAKRKLRAAA